MLAVAQRKMYISLVKQRRNFIHLLSRMDLSREQVVLFLVKEEEE